MCNSYQDPFEEYKKRQQKLRMRKAAAEEKGPVEKPSSNKDNETNWFGHKLGLEKDALVVGSGGGVGKYLNLNGVSSSNGVKRGAELSTTTGLPDEGKKKRKIGFGDFEAW